MTTAKPRACLFCQHWDFYPGHPGYSEWTLGDVWESRCGKGHWRMTGYDDDEADWRRNMAKGADCKDFEEAK